MDERAAVVGDGVGDGRVKDISKIWKTGRRVDHHNLPGDFI